MRKIKKFKKKNKFSGHAKKAVAAQQLNEIATAITPEESQRRADLKRIFEQIEAGRLKTKKFPKGVTIDSLIEEGRRF